MAAGLQAAGASPVSFIPVTKTSTIRLGIAAVVLAVALALAWWGTRTYQKRELQQEVVALVRDSTSRLQEALGLMTAGVEVRARLEASFGALQGNVEKLQSMDARLDPPLVRAAEAYITDVHALLRRQLATHGARDALRADLTEIAEHLRSAGGRSADWIKRALALKQRLEKNFFDYRFASGGLEKSLRALHDTRKGLEPLVPPTLLIYATLLSAAEKQLLEMSEQIRQQVENARKLPERG